MGAPRRGPGARAAEHDGEHVSAEEQIVQARAALNAATTAEQQLSFDELGP